MLKLYSSEDFQKHVKRSQLLPLLIILVLLSLIQRVETQGRGGNTLFGDLKVDGIQGSDLKLVSFEIILYTESGIVVSRQTISNNGRYRFLNLANGRYVIVVEVENNVVARVPVSITAAFKIDVREDISLVWHPNAAGNKKGKAASISAADYYKRPAASRDRFEKAGEAIDKKNYELAVTLLRQIVSDDPKDFQAWTELGTAYLIQKNLDEAEKAYVRATKEQPTFFLALIDLAKLRMMRKNYEGAIEPLSQAVKVQPQSANATYLLGESYLQIKKGSKAVGYLNEALRLDPIGMADVHLRLAALYNGAGVKDKAATEYEQFLQKKPDYPDKKKLQQYITENKKR